MMKIEDKLPIDFYLRDTVEVARELLGKVFVRETDAGILAVKIVETEAYSPFGDDANHSARGRTPRNAMMHEPGGILYVYKIYGIHYCVNVVTEGAGHGSAVLLRAGKPIEGIDVMQGLRGTDDETKLCSGPGNFAKAFDISTENNGASLLGDEFAIYAHSDNREIVTDRRIGISKAIDLPYRFYFAGCKYVSAKKLK